MKANTKATLLGALAATTVYASLPALLPREARAQEPPKAAAIAAPASEEYRILSLATFSNDTSTARMEAALNKLAADGWKVRTGAGVTLVLAR